MFLIACDDKVTESNPTPENNEPVASVDSGYNQIKLGNYSKARASFEAVISLTKDTTLLAKAHTGIAFIELNSGDLSASEVSITNALAKEKLHKEALYLGAIVQFAQQKDGNARLKQLIAINASYTFPYYNAYTEKDLYIHRLVNQFQNGDFAFCYTELKSKFSITALGDATTPNYEDLLAKISNLADTEFLSN